MFDCHVHSDKSSDSILNICDIVNKIKDDNLGIILTEHIDLNYPDKELFKLETEEYIKSYYKYRSDKLLLGIEIGLSIGFENQYTKIIDNNDLDFVLGAVHELEGKDLYDVKEIYVNPKKEVYEKYFEYMLECIKTNPYIDSFAHIDYICRYATYKDTEIYYNDYSEYIDEVLKALIQRGICFEINTRRLGNKSVYDALMKIYRRYNELGGEYITIGSDAHLKENIAMNFEEAKEIVRSCGLKPVYFVNRKMKLL
ncbi:histidinol phosphate phosphatase [Clostridium sp. DL1XJH146]